MSQTPNPVSSSLSWEEILRTNRIETRHIDWAINNIDSAPVVPYEFVYKDFSSKVYRPVSISVSGVGGVIGALLALKHTTTNELKYFITTEDVVNAPQNSPLYISKYALEKLTKMYPSVQVVTLKINEFDKVKLILKLGGVYVSGLPNELLIQISQLAGFGKVWHYSAIHRKFYIF